MSGNLLGTKTENKMKLEETRVQADDSYEMRYQVTLSTNVSEIEMYWRTRVTAMSPDQAYTKAQKLFKKFRGRYQDAILRQWDSGI
jgi:hypothetical protein